MTYLNHIDDLDMLQYQFIVQRTQLKKVVLYKGWRR